jgi:long-chain alkane monooxygenase
VADRLQEWIEETDIDGFNLVYAVMPETYEDIIELLVPELQRRGVYKKEYRPGTLREKLFQQGPYLPENHHGSQFRR